MTVLSGAIILLSALFFTIALICAYTWLSTSIAYHLDTRSQSKSAGKVSAVPPLIPYAVPGLGSTISFSTQKVGTFFRYLRGQSTKHGLQAYSIVLSGKRTHFIFSADGISSLFKSRSLSRSDLDVQLGQNVLAMSKDDAVKAFAEGPENKEKQSTARIHSENLLSVSAVNALTRKCMECLRATLDDEVALEDGVELDLYAWLWKHVFVSSSTALYGPKLLEMHPNFDKDYRVWEDNMLAMLFGKPRLFARDAYAARDTTVAKLQSWLEEGYKHSKPDDDADWEPNFGARVTRKRHEFYSQQGMSIKGQAGDDLIFLAGILSNATPATGWLLLHILAPHSLPDFQARIVAEVKSVRRPDGTIDVPALTRLPLLNSAFHEVLRVYVDLLVVRQVDESTSLGHHHVRKGDMVMAPTWMTHRNAEFFERPDEFDLERFLVEDPETGVVTYSTTGLNGKYFPFGGGHYMCPVSFAISSYLLRC